MTRRMPVLPQKYCDDCPCHTFDRAAVEHVCKLQLSPYYPAVRSTACIADELAWRNVAAGLAMVACYERGYGHGRRHDQ